MNPTLSSDNIPTTTLDQTAPSDSASEWREGDDLATTGLLASSSFWIGALLSLGVWTLIVVAFIHA